MCDTPVRIGSTVAGGAWSIHTERHPQTVTMPQSGKQKNKTLQLHLLWRLVAMVIYSVGCVTIGQLHPSDSSPSFPISILGVCRSLPGRKCIINSTNQRGSWSLVGDMDAGEQLHSGASGDTRNPSECQLTSNPTQVLSICQLSPNHPITTAAPSA